MVLPIIGATIIGALFSVTSIGPTAGGLFAALQPIMAPGLLAGVQSVAMGGSTTLSGWFGASFVSLFGYTGWYLSQLLNPDSTMMGLSAHEIETTCQFCACEYVDYLEDIQETWVFCNYKPHKLIYCDENGNDTEIPTTPGIPTFTQQMEWFYRWLKRITTTYAKNAANAAKYGAQTVADTVNDHIPDMEQVIESAKMAAHEANVIAGRVLHNTIKGFENVAEIGAEAAATTKEFAAKATTEAKEFTEKAAAKFAKEAKEFTAKAATEAKAFSTKAAIEAAKFAEEAKKATAKAATEANKFAKEAAKYGAKAAEEAKRSASFAAKQAGDFASYLAKNIGEMDTKSGIPLEQVGKAATEAKRLAGTFLKSFFG